MDLRVAAQGDWQASRDIRLRALTYDPGAFCSTLERESGFSDQDWRDRLGRGITILAWDGPNPIGTVTGRPDSDTLSGPKVAAMWVDPAFRGTGIGDALLASVIRWAGVGGAHELTLWVAENNLLAISLYERNGFKLTGEREEMRPEIDQVRMRKDLL